MYSTFTFVNKEGRIESDFFLNDEQKKKEHATYAHRVVNFSFSQIC